MKLSEAPGKLTGIELLRSAVRIFNNGNETFAGQFDEDKLLKIAQAWKACEWDIHPDQWTERQIIELLDDDKIPEWDEDERPKYD